jgi:hypothetical protein
MNDYAMLKLSKDKQRDFERARTNDRLRQIVRCCQPSAIWRWLRSGQPVRPVVCCA